MYKIILNNKIIDVVKHPKFIKYLANGHIALTNPSSANGIVGSDNKTLYSFCYIDGRREPIVSIAEIDENEFSRLECLLNSEDPVYADETVLINAKQQKLEFLSAICKNKITAGFTLNFAGEKHNFKLTLEDQLNLIQIENRIAAGDTCFVYHATGEPCRMYSKREMLKITKAFRKHVQYHTTYYNVVKQYINSLTDIDKINQFEYGMDISFAVDDVVLKQILERGGC